MTRNHSAWFAANALTAGGEVRRDAGAAYIFTPGSQGGASGGEVVIAFPRVPEAEQGAVLDRILTFCRQRAGAESGNVRQVSCWTATPNGPRGLGARLAARGFEYGWQAHWMALDLHDLPAVARPVQDVRVGLVDDDSANAWANVPGLPYGGAEVAPRLRSIAQKAPRHVFHFAAWEADRIVGHVALFLTTGAPGAAGIYNVGVIPEARKRGIGRALMQAASACARDLGCHYALLNSAATEFYLRLGWTSLGHGQTWWMHAPALTSPPPTPAQVRFAEAVGLGDLAALDALAGARGLPTDLDTPLLNGMTPLMLAVRAKQSGAARWLLARGATPDVLALWDLGRKAQAARALKASPALVDRSYQGVTPLHHAVARDDITLARFLFDHARPDLMIKDTRYNSTPLGWARHMGRTEIAALIEAAR